MAKKGKKQANPEKQGITGLPMAEKIEGFETKDLDFNNPPRKMINGARQRDSK